MIAAHGIAAGPVDGDVQQRARYVLAGVRIRVDGRPVAGETTVTAAEPSVLMLSPPLASSASQSPAPTSARTAVTPSPHTSLSPASGAPSSKPNFGRRSPGHPRERCLLDHVHQLQQALVVPTGGTVAIDIAQGALTRAPPSNQTPSLLAWRDPSRPDALIRDQRCLRPRPRLARWAYA